MSQPKFEGSETMPDCPAPVIMPVCDDDFAASTLSASPARALQSHLERAGLVSCQDEQTEFGNRTNGAVVIIVVAAGFCWAVAAAAAAWLAFG